MDTTFVAPTVVDSAFIHDAVARFLPGIHPGFVALVAAFLASRALWVVRLLVRYGPVIVRIPGLQNLLNAVKLLWEGKPGQKGIGWLVNPALMVLAGWWATGSLGWGALVGFAGTGIREWLISSPIPTSKEEFNKVFKPKMGIILVAVAAALALSATARAQPALSMQRVALAAGGGWKQEYRHRVDGRDYPWIGARASYIVSAHLKAELEWERQLHAAPDQNLRAGLWVVF